MSQIYPTAVFICDLPVAPENRHSWLIGYAYRDAEGIELAQSSATLKLLKRLLVLPYSSTDGEWVLSNKTKTRNHLDLDGTLWLSMVIKASEKTTNKYTKSLSTKKFDPWLFVNVNFQCVNKYFTEDIHLYCILWLNFMVKLHKRSHVFSKSFDWIY